VLSLTCVAEGDERNQRYVEGDEVILSTQRIAVLWSAKPPLQNHPFCVCLVEFCDGVQVTLWVNKVGPYENPQETYPFYMLPFCKVRSLAMRSRGSGIGFHWTICFGPKMDRSRMVTRWAGFGEALEGNSLVKSDFDVRFRKDITKALS
jgi:hypothetical protein